MKKLKKKALAVVLAVTTVWGSSTPVFAATVTNYRKQGDRFQYGISGLNYYSNYNDCTLNPNRFKSGCDYVNYVMSKRDHAAMVTNSYNRKSSGWKYAKCHKTAKASVRWSWRGTGWHYCQYKG